MPDTPIHMATLAILVPALICSFRNAYLADKKSNEAEDTINQNKELFNFMNDKVRALNSLDESNQENKRVSGKTFTKKFHR